MQGQINATLVTLSYQGTLNYIGPDTLTITSTDTNSGTELDTLAITIFTQANIEARRVIFALSGAAVMSDSFTLTVR